MNLLFHAHFSCQKDKRAHAKRGDRKGSSLIPHFNQVGHTLVTDPGALEIRSNLLYAFHEA